MLRVTIRGLLAHKVRLVATAVAVLLGVAFMTGTQVLTTSVGASFDKVFADVYAPIDVVVRSSTEVDTPFGSQRTRIEGSLVPSLASVPGVSAAEGQVVAQIRVLGRDGKPLVPSQGPPNFGLNWLTSPALNGWTIVAGEPPVADGEIVLDAKTAADGDFAVGDQVSVSLTDGVRPFTVVGVARFGDVDTWGGAQAALFDTETAQAIVGEAGRFDWISVAGDGISQEELRDRVAATLPPGTEAITGDAFTEESQDAFQKIIAVFNTFLLAFALIALFVGSFIIYNTFSVIVAQRTRELGLLRALGARRGQVLASVLVEAAVVGVVASAVGVVLGVALAVGLDALLRNIGFAGPPTPLVVPLSAVVSSLAVGTFITLAAAIGPARRAATIPPIAAMRDHGTESRTTSLRRILLGVAMLVAAVAATWQGLFGTEDGNLQVLGVGALLALLAMTVLGPVIGPGMAAVLGAPLPKLLGVDGRMARENALRNPRRTASTASAVMIGVALVGFIAVTAQSVKASTAAAIDASVQGQYIITTDGFGPTALPAAVAEDVRALPEVAAAAGLRGTFASVNGSNRLVLASDPDQLTQLIDIDDVEGSLDSLDDSGIAITKKSADEQGLVLGQEVTAAFLQGTQQLRIEAIYDTRFPHPRPRLARHPRAVRRQQPPGSADRFGGVHPARGRLRRRDRRRPPGAAGDRRRRPRRRAAGRRRVPEVPDRPGRPVPPRGLRAARPRPGDRDRRRGQHPPAVGDGADPGAGPAPGRGHDPTPGAVEHPVGVADHRLHRHDHRPRAGSRLRMGARPLAPRRRHHRLPDPLAPAGDHRGAHRAGRHRCGHVPGVAGVAPGRAGRHRHGVTGAVDP